MVFKSNGYYDRIIFANVIILYQARKKFEHNIHYNTNQWKIKESFEIINNISVHVTLVQLMKTVGNVNHIASIERNWIFD